MKQNFHASVDCLGPDVYSCVTSANTNLSAVSGLHFHASGGDAQTGGRHQLDRKKGKGFGWPGAAGVGVDGRLVRDQSQAPAWAADARVLLLPRVPPACP